jgi:hypothetical protein
LLTVTAVNLWEAVVGTVEEISMISARISLLCSCKQGI